MDHITAVVLLLKVVQVSVNSEYLEGTVKIVTGSELKGHPV